MSAPRIDAYRFGHIVIDDNEFENDVIVFPDRVRDNWWRKEGHVLHVEDLDDVVAAEPDTLIVGQGAYGRMAIPEETRRAIEDAGISIISAETDEAVDAYNSMRKQGKIVAALHLTC